MFNVSSSEHATELPSGRNTETERKMDRSPMVRGRYNKYSPRPSSLQFACHASCAPQVSWSMVPWPRHGTAVIIGPAAVPVPLRRSTFLVDDLTSSDSICWKLILPFWVADFLNKLRKSGLAFWTNASLGPPRHEVEESDCPWHRKLCRNLDHKNDLQQYWL